MVFVSADAQIEVLQVFILAQLLSASFKPDNPTLDDVTVIRRLQSHSDVLFHQQKGELMGFSNIGDYAENLLNQYG